MEDYLNLSALYYDVTKPVGRSLDGDLEFYEHHITNSKKVLEAGVGTGRLLIPYLQKGIHIEGIDLSQDMLDVCESKCKEFNVSTRLMQGSVIDYEFDKYDAIIVPTGTFCLFPHIDKVLENFFQTLEEDGFVLFDLIFPTEFKEGKVFTYPLDLDDNNSLILYDNHLKIDWIKQQTTELLTYELWEKGKLSESELQKFVINWYGIQEMYLLLEWIGFTDIEIFGDYGDFDLNENYGSVSFKAYKRNRR